MTIVTPEQAAEQLAVCCRKLCADMRAMGYEKASVSHVTGSYYLCESVGNFHVTGHLEDRYKADFFKTFAEARAFVDNLKVISAIVGPGAAVRSEAVANG